MPYNRTIHIHFLLSNQLADFFLLFLLGRNTGYKGVAPWGLRSSVDGFDVYTFRTNEFRIYMWMKYKKTKQNCLPVQPIPNCRTFLEKKLRWTRHLILLQNPDVHSHVHKSTVFDSAKQVEISPNLRILFLHCPFFTSSLNPVFRKGHVLLRFPRQNVETVSYFP